MPGPKLALGLQGGGTHGAFTWGVLDRLLEELEHGRIEFTAISGASAGALNATITAAALCEGGPALARARLDEFWRSVSESGKRAGNALLGFGDYGPFGYNIDDSPGAIFWEAIGLVVSPYTNPFYRDSLTPLLQRALPPERLARLNEGGGPRLFLSAVDVATSERVNFSQPEVSVDALRASCALPAEFKAVQLNGASYWDGGYLGNPALAPMIEATDASDLLLVMVNPLRRQDMPPRGPRAILDRLNEITFNASVILEMTAIDTINGLLDEMAEQGHAYTGAYRKINVHLIRDDDFMAQFGFVSKNSTSWPLLKTLHDRGREVAGSFLRANGDKLGRESTVDVKAELTGPVLNTGARPGGAGA